MPVSINQQQTQTFSHLELLARQVVEGFITGLHKSPFHGFSVEFAEHRLYNKGEPTKHIDWKLYGRTDKLFVKRYEEETNLRCQLVIDDSSSMYFPMAAGKDTPPNKITFSIHCAAALMLLLKKQRDAVGLSIFSDHVEVNTATKSSSLHHKLLFNELEKRLEPISVDIRRKTMAVEALHEIAESIHKRSLVIIFSDMFDARTNPEDLFSALQHLRHNKHEVILFHVTDKSKELDFEFENRPYRFVDMETGEELKLNPSEVKDNYVKAIQDFKAELKLR
ncbi:MAG TPA: DUF58 domain-containing protein, partial [Bacteroidia bacterium]|nr:DUF58 domain-containing protein [Bacteroidia bacterium]